MFFGFNVFDPKNSPAINTQQEAYKSKFTAVSGPPLALSPRLPTTYFRKMHMDHPSFLPSSPHASFRTIFRGFQRHATPTG